MARSRDKGAVAKQMQAEMRAGDGTGGSTAFRDGRGGGEGMRAPHEVMAGGKPEGRHRGMPRPGRVSRDVTGLKLNFGARVTCSGHR